MTATVDLTEALILASLRSMLLSLLSCVEVIRAETNRVPEPVGPDFCLLTPMLRTRLSTNITSWRDGFFATPPVPGTRRDMQPTQLTVQVDVHGPNSANTTQIIATLFRSDVVTATFDALGSGVQALYAEEPRQSPFTNDSDQIEYRWTIDLVLQANITVTTAQDFAGVVKVGLTNADA